MAKRWNFRVNHHSVQLVPNCDTLVNKIEIASKRKLSLKESILLSDMAKDVLKHKKILPRQTLKTYNAQIHNILFQHQYD